jgi:hypothetical protein
MMSSSTTYLTAAILSKTPTLPLFSRSRSIASTSTRPERSATPVAAPQRNIVVPRDQWFIRRALLAKDARERERKESSDGIPATQSAGSLSTPSSRPSTPSLANLLASDLPPPDAVEGYQPPAYFHLRENNRGWQMLKNIGWDGQGGLGRVVDSGFTGFAFACWAGRT